jgi:hypothetical protein
MAQAIQNKTVQFWCEQIAIYDKTFQKWNDGGKKIVKRYKAVKNDGTSNTNAASFNILWSNVQTLAPALYAKNPIPNIDRRFEDDDKVGTTAARVLERATSYFIDSDLFGNVMSQVVIDRLLPGRGVSWVRYVPNFKDSAEVTDDVTKGHEAPQTPELYSEDVVVDYVHYPDFGHTWARTWEEVRGVWRIVYMAREEMKARAFKNWKDIPLETVKENDEDKPSIAKAKIYEIWDKVKKEVVWIHKGMEEELDRRSDPLGLKDFFPCPKPLYSTLANDNLIPTPDYVQYDTQAKELDDLTARIASIQKSLKVAGVYDGSAEGLDRILSEGLDSTLVPVENWALFAEKGGINGAISWLPMKEIADVLVELYQVRETVKQDLYEITGISDIIRGATDANETATAQELKGKFATLRLDNMQKDTARFSRDLVNITAQIIAEHFSLDTIKQISGIKLLTTVEKQQLMAQASQPGPPGPDGQPTPPQPVPDELQELLDSPTWEEVEGLLRDDVQRCFRISIETDSTIKQDQEAEKAARIELVGAVGTFLEKAAVLPPQLQPLAAELLQFGLKGFKISRELETSFELALKEIKKAADAPPQPDPEQLKVEAEMKNDEEQRGLEREKMGQEKYLADQNFDLEQQKIGLEKEKMTHEGKKMDNEKLAMRLDAKTKVAPEVAMSDPDMNDMEVTPVASQLNQIGEMIMQGLQQIAQQQAQANQVILQAVTAPKKTIVERGPDGKITGGVSVVEPPNGTIQ